MTEPVAYYHPATWRQIMRDEAKLRGWSRKRMRRELRKAGHTLDPWKVPLPVINEDLQRELSGALSGTDALFGLDATVDNDRLAGWKASTSWQWKRLKP